MQIKLFNIPISDNGQALEEMNGFLRGNKILETTQQFYQNDRTAIWCFCIKYLDSTKGHHNAKPEKIDYKNVLKAPEFERFSKLREWRRDIAKEEAVPAYLVFTDEELAGIAKLEEVTLAEISQIKGIGKKKTEKYGQKIIDFQIDEKSGKPDRSDS